MRPVAVTGIGAVSALGDGVDPLFSRLLAGESGLGPAPWPTARPGQDWRAAASEPRRACSALAVAAARQALGARDPAEVWVVCGSSAGDMVEGEAAWMAWHRGEAFPAGALLWPQLPDRPAEAVRAALGCAPPAIAVSTACTAGAVAIQVAADLVRAGRARAALAVGADALSRLTWYGFGALGLQAQGPARPLDRARAGLNLGDGAAALLIEPVETARAPLALLVGDSSTSEAYNLVTPHPEGRGAREVIAAMQQFPGTLGWVHAHATGTPQNDAVEARVLAELLPGVPVSGTKGALGHTLGAAGALGAVVAVRSLQTGWIPPAVGTRDPLPGLDVVLAPRRLAAPRCLSLAFGFGGGSTALLWARP